ncbi:Delta(3 5)-Delta(2 4)-dienoyl-CoA isomerase mitochondrial [Fasciola gigantica]|uniref:Delta(3,5)-Delta(2,4)-dienoyl-CoA isomerase, mitochondrial n=1 Tax=Fasciola gigantica TaxID=46835 RepID=A0A504Y8Z5_FASGI|nr:Delta(3 5)-Delta(2 4)-dienoyl-CoA isomerase mitochondrial [Fasciola gigantica]
MFARLGLSSSEWTPVFRVTRFLRSQGWNTYELSQKDKYVLHLQFNNPEKRNSMNLTFWKETKEIFSLIQSDPGVRAVVLSGQGKMFSSGENKISVHVLDCLGMDLDEFPKILTEVAHRDASRCGLKLHRFIESLQDTFNCLERCDKPVIAAIHGGCIGAAVNMVAVADIRYCSQDAWFQIKELELGIAADIGIIQRLPRLVGSESLARELIFTARRFSAAEALHCGFVSRVLETPDQVVEEAIRTAKRIAQLSPVAVQTSKRSVVYSRDHGVLDGLAHLANLNQLMLQSQDVVKAMKASVSKTEPHFDDL